MTYFTLSRSPLIIDNFIGADANGIYHVTLRARFVNEQFGQQWAAIALPPGTAHQFSEAEVEAMKIGFARKCPRGSTELDEQHFREVMQLRIRTHRRPFYTFCFTIRCLYTFCFIVLVSLMDICVETGILILPFGTVAA